MMTATAEAKAHRFETAGLGLAPFRLIAVRENVFVACPGATPKPGGCCAYCANGIRWEYVIRSADAKVFTVGSDCAEKVGDAGLSRVVAQEKARVERESRHAREDAKIAAGRELFEANRERLAAMPHPTASRAAKGDTFVDYVEWTIRNAGRSGTIAALNVMRRKLEGK